MSVKVLEKKFFVFFILIMSLFVFWGFVNDIINLMVVVF